MRKLIVFNNVSVDGYFVDAAGDLSWAHQDSNDAEWNAFVSGNAKGGGTLVFGRKTYQMMAGYWPTPMAAKQNPVVAEQLNARSKVVFSKTLKTASWQNTKLVKGPLASAVRKLKSEPGKDMVILGSGHLVAQLAQKNLIDEYQVVVNPIVLGGGRTMFDGLAKRLRLRLKKSRAFRNGNVWLSYVPTID